MASTHCAFCKNALEDYNKYLPEEKRDYGGMCLYCLSEQPYPKEENIGGEHGIIAQERQMLEGLRGKPQRPYGKRVTIS